MDNELYDHLTSMERRLTDKISEVSGVVSRMEGIQGQLSEDLNQLENRVDTIDNRDKWWGAINSTFIAIATAIGLYK